MKTTSLDIDALSEQATAACGFDDYGDPGFLEGLGVYLDAAVVEAGLTESGAATVAAGVTGRMMNRLRIEHDLRSFPEIVDEQIDDPIIIVGLPRTGTTKLQSMIASDPGMQCVRNWQIINPAPLPGEERGSTENRIQIARFVEQMLLENAPGLMAAHSFAALDPQEEVLLQFFTYEGLCSGLEDNTPSYLAWVSSRSPRAAYAYMDRLLKYLQWQDGGAQGRGWILKSPLHTGNLDLLFDLYPSATVVHCHRDPTVAVASFCRLFEGFWESRGNRFTPGQLGRTMMGVLEDQAERHLAFRRGHDGHRPIVDVLFDDVVTDAIGVIERIYQAANRTLDQEAETRMRAWEAGSEHLGGTHTYTLEHYELTPESVRAQMEPYFELYESIATAR